MGNLFFHSNTQFVNENVLRVDLDKVKYQLLPARSRCVGVYVTKVFVVDQFGKECLNDLYHSNTNGAINISDGSQFTPDFVDPKPIWCVSNRHNFLSGFGRPDFDYFRSGSPQNMLEFFDALSIVSFPVWSVRQATPTAASTIASVGNSRRTIPSPVAAPTPLRTR